MAGIARDDASGLNQLKSQSLHDDLITMEADALEDGDALVWGHNGEDIAYNVTTDDHRHMSRIWKVQVTDVGAVTVTVAADDALYLLVSDSDDFSDATEYAVDASISIDFTDGQYFTLAKDPLAAPVITEPEDGDSLNPGDDPLTVSGTADITDTVGVTVTLYDADGEVVDTCTADTFDAQTGAWSCELDLEDLDDGDYTIIAVATDADGNSSASDPTTFTLDTTPTTLPTDLQVISDAPGVVDEATTFTATVSAGEPVTYTWDFGDGNTGNGSPISHIYQQAGEYTVIVTATNAVGPVSATLTVVIGDAVVIVTPDAGDVITHTNPDGSGTIVEIPAGTLTETLELVYTELDDPTADPPATILRYAGRAFSLKLYRNGELVTDTVAFDPPITVTLIYTDSDVDWLNLDTLEVYYWSVANQQWEQDGITHVEHDRANRRLILTLAHLTDFAMFAEPMDTTPPDAPVITAPISGTVTNHESLTVTGTADVTDTVGIVVTLYDEDDNPVATCTADAFDPDTGAWSCDLDLSELADGDYTIIAEATDASGNSSESDPVAITLDATPPAAPTVTAPEDGSTLMLDPPTFAGTAEPGATVEVRDDEGNVLCEAVADENGDWMCTPEEPLGEGEHTIEVVAIDEAGNESAPAELTITIEASDNLPPVAVDDEWNVPESVPAQPSSTLDVLANDSDPDGDAITITHVSEPNNGTAATDGATIVYTPTAGFLGEVAFTYTISDGALEATANVTLTVLPVADLAVEQHIRATLGGYDIIFVARNLGPRDVIAPGAVLSSTIPAEFGTITWACETSGGAECPNATGGGLTFSETLTIFPAHSVVTYTLTAQNSDNAIVWNTVTLTPPATMFDLDMTNNIHSRPSAYRLILPVIYKNADFSTP